MTKIHIGQSELINAFKTHARFAKEEQTPSHKLLLFYSVECGLKAKLLKNSSRFNTQYLTDGDLTHDLGHLIKEARLPPMGEEMPTNFQLKNFKKDRDKENYHISDAHQIWRYGRTIKERDEQKLITWLEKVEEKLQEDFL